MANNDLYDEDEAAEAHDRITRGLDGDETESEPTRSKAPRHPTPEELAEAKRKLFSSKPNNPPGPTGEEIARARDRLLGSSKAAAQARREDE